MNAVKDSFNPYVRIEQKSRAALFRLSDVIASHKMVRVQSGAGVCRQIIKICCGVVYTLSQSM